MKKKLALLPLIFTLLFVQQLNAQNNSWSATDKFRNCMTSMQSTNDEVTRFNYAMQYFVAEHSTTIQLQDACYYLYSDQKKYELCVAAYPNIIDKDHFFKIYDSFSTFSYAIKLYHNTQEKEQFVTFQNDYQLSTSQNNDATFDLLIQKGDLLLSNNEFDAAIAVYKEALQLKPGHEVPTQRIEQSYQLQLQLAQIVNEENKMNAQFDALIQQGDQMLASNQVDQAIALYEQAMQLKPGDPIAYERIKEANHWQQTLTDIADEENKIQAEYDFLIQKGEILVSSNKFDEGIAVYEQAKALKPNDQTAYIKINEAERRRQAFIQASTVCKTSDSEFANILKAIEDQSFSADQMEMARTYISKKCLSIEQLKQIVFIFNMDGDKLEMIKYMYNYTHTPERMYEFRETLTFSSTKQEFDEFIANRQ